MLTRNGVICLAECSEQLLLLFTGNTDACISDAEAEATESIVCDLDADIQRYCSLLSKLDRITQQIRQHLTQAELIPNISFSRTVIG